MPFLEPSDRPKGTEGELETEAFRLLPEAVIELVKKCGSLNNCAKK
jgi:hypothetical protein